MVRPLGSGIKKDTREQGRVTGGTGETGETGETRILSFLLLLFFLSSLSGAPRPMSIVGGRLASTALVFMRNQVAQSSLPLLVAKVAQKPRTTSLAEARVAKPKTNASQAKRLPSSFLNGFATLASRDRPIGRLPANDAKCGF